MNYESILSKRLADSIQLESLHFDILFEITKYLSLDDLINFSKVNKVTYTFSICKPVLHLFKNEILSRFKERHISISYIRIIHPIETDIRKILKSNKLFYESTFIKEQKIKLISKNELENVFDDDNFFGGYVKLIKIMHNNIRVVQCPYHGCDDNYIYSKCEYRFAGYIDEIFANILYDRSYERYAFRSKNNWLHEYNVKLTHKYKTLIEAAKQSNLIIKYEKNQAKESNNKKLPKIQPKSGNKNYKYKFNSKNKNKNNQYKYLPINHKLARR